MAKLVLLPKFQDVSPHSWRCLVFGISVASWGHASFRSAALPLPLIPITTSVFYARVHCSPLYAFHSARFSHPQWGTGLACVCTCWRSISRTSQAAHCQPFLIFASLPKLRLRYRCPRRCDFVVSVVVGSIQHAVMPLWAFDSLIRGPASVLR